MKHIALVIFDYFEYGGVQKDLDALGKMLREVTANQEEQLRLTMLCMHNRSRNTPSWCDEVREVVPPWYIFSNHRRAKWFDRQLKRIRESGEFDLLVGFNRTGNLDFYFAADDCLKEKYSRRSKFASLMPRGKTFLALEKQVFAPPEAGGAGKIFTITAPQQEAFMRCYPECSADRFRLMPPNLAGEYFERGSMAELRADARNEFSATADTLLFIQIAAAFRTKGVDRSLQLLAEAKRVAILNDFKFIVVGGTSPRAIAEMKKIASEHNLSDAEVIFTGPRQDIRRLLCGADLMIHPARAESAGSVLIEALASGVPVISSGICGYNSFIRTAAAGMFFPEPFELAGGVKILQNALETLPELRSNSLTYAGNSIVRENFQRARTEAELILKTFETVPLDFSREP